MTAEGLDFRVRDGIGYFPFAINTPRVFIQKTSKNIIQYQSKVLLNILHTSQIHIKHNQASRQISTGQLNTSLYLHTQPINLVVYKVSLGGLNPQRYLILKMASRLDAFSGYPFPT